MSVLFKNKVEKFRDSIFLVTRERSCPLYNVGDELKVEYLHASISDYKPVCLHLVDKLKEITSQKASSGLISNIHTPQKITYGCRGCENSSIDFEYKKDKDYITLQMKLLNEAEAKRRKRHLDKFFGPLRKLDLLETLDDDALIDLTLLLELKTIPVDKVVIKMGEPGMYLFIILSGTVVVMGDEGERLAEIGEGDIFGEMSLLSGEPITRTIHTVTETKVAMMSKKNFKFIMKKYPILQLFLLKLLMRRAQTMTIRSGQITSGMSGELSEVKTVDLLQLINSTQKTGILTLTLETGRAMVVFQEGEIIQAKYLGLDDKEALFSLLGIDSGHFSYERGILPEMEDLQPIGGFMGMLMEGLQHIDEVAE